MAMKRLCKSFPLIFLMMFCFLGFAEIGNAYCVHNDTDMTLSVNGDWCNRCYGANIHSGTTGCCPGQDSGCGGTTVIYVYHQAHDVGNWVYCPCQVTAHGDVYISGPDLYHLSCTVYDDSYNLICAGPMICCYL
jgi:hypothetical protein